MGLSNYLPSSRIAQPGVCTSTTRPATPYEGQVIYETDTNRVLVYDASAWVSPNSTTSNPPGLERITACTVTSVGGTSATASDGVIAIGSGNTSITVNDAFSSNYQSYRVFIENNDTNGSASHQMQLSGITTNSYFTGGNYGSWGGATQTSFGPAATNIWTLSANTAAGTGTVIIVDLTNPNIARRKYGSVMSQAGNGYLYMQLYATSTLTATGFVLSKSGETMTGGTIRVYGYRN